MKWKIKKFNELSTKELYEIYRVRVEIFVKEQACPYQEVDQTDLKCYHLFSQDYEGKIIAYVRLIPEQEGIRIGRVLVSKEQRGQGLGSSLLTKAIQTIEALYPERKILLQAQSYLLAFYQSFGFTEVSEEYLEDQIPHIDMEMLQRLGISGK